MEQQTGSKLGKEHVKAVYCHPAYFNLNAQYIMRNAGLDEAQAGIKIARGNINNLRYANDTTLMVTQRIKPRSPTLQAGALTSEPPGKPWQKLKRN